MNFSSKKFVCKEFFSTFAIPSGNNAEIAQLVERNLAKVEVASPSLVYRSIFSGGNPCGAVAKW